MNAAAGPQDTERGISEQLRRVTGSQAREIHLLGHEHQWQHYRVVLASGKEAFAKIASSDLGGIFEAEARGLRWLSEANAVPLPEVLGWDGATMVVELLHEQTPDHAAAERFGRDLAVLHARGAERFGTPWPGFIASLPLGDRTGDAPTVAAEAAVAATDAGVLGPAMADFRASGGGLIRGGGSAIAGDWASWYASKRLLPYLRLAADTGALPPESTGLVEEVVHRVGELAGPPEPPSRIHGDCWAGNVLWSGGRGWLIDPAAHGGHRETDLAMLDLFGAPFLDRIIAAYQEVSPLAPGWQQRVPLHQLHPLLVHACLYGGSYGNAVLGAALSALAA